MRVLVTKECGELYGKMLDVPYYATSTWCIPIPKPVRTAWQWHELYEYISKRKKKTLNLLACNMKMVTMHWQDPDKCEEITVEVTSKYNELLQKCKSEMMK